MSASAFPKEHNIAPPTTPVTQRFASARAALNFGVPLLLGLLLWFVWLVTARQVLFTVDGYSDRVFTHRTTVDALLTDLDLALESHDRITPARASGLQHNGVVRVERARPVEIVADGRRIEIESWGATGKQIMLDAALSVDRHDLLTLENHALSWDDPLPAAIVQSVPVAEKRDWEKVMVEPLALRVQRSIPVTIEQDDFAFELKSTAQTVGEMLHNAGITVYAGDMVEPALSSPISTGLRVRIERSMPVAVQVDDRLIKTRTRAHTVADALSELGFGLSGLDTVSPSLSEPLRDDLAIKITRIREEVEIDEDVEPFETLFLPDAELLIDTQQLTNPGAAGVTRRRSRVRYEDGAEVSRVLEDTWIAQEPVPRTIAFGQKIVPQTYVTSNGDEISYWRKIRVITTSYSANTAGVPKSAAWYGITFTGEKMRRGIVAVDPRVIPLRTKTYVDGYGLGEALDTGSAIKGRRVDLGYDDWNLKLWNKWSDIYLLWPPPPDYQITWVLPNWPAVPQ